MNIEYINFNVDALCTIVITSENKKFMETDKKREICLNQWVKKRILKQKKSKKYILNENEIN
ncbi:14902_t:CDS:1, partial [Dentiscutata erythropus]